MGRLRRKGANSEVKYRTKARYYSEVVPLGRVSSAHQAVMQHGTGFHAHVHFLRLCIGKYGLRKIHPSVNALTGWLAIVPLRFRFVKLPTPDTVPPKLSFPLMFSSAYAPCLNGKRLAVIPIRSLALGLQITRMCVNSGDPISSMQSKVRGRTALLHKACPSLFRILSKNSVLQQLSS